mmetsp:Transcript_63493/g.138292  ORF Transcript_63493/g.138292 Transcript_63493/m.138292 type:complete len:220 (-) Transcript_63493:57-716(-)
MSGVQKYKVVFLGDEAAGKTSLVRRYMYDSFDESIQATIGMDFQSKTVHLEDRTVRLQLWDTAGQERFRSLIPSYIRDAAAAVIVYDITKRSSFMATQKWIEDVRAERGDDAQVALVGNKSDLTSNREVPKEEGSQRAEELGVAFVETSAKFGDSVATLFQLLAAKLPAPVIAESQGPPDSAGSTAAASSASGAEARAAPAIQLGGQPAAPSHKKKCEC